jgi:hypothetical protein
MLAENTVSDKRSGEIFVDNFIEEKKREDRKSQCTRNKCFFFSFAGRPHYRTEEKKTALLVRTVLSREFEHEVGVIWVDHDSYLAYQTIQSKDSKEEFSVLFSGITNFYSFQFLSFYGKSFFTTA